MSRIQASKEGIFLMPGVMLIESKYMTDRVRVRTHKKKRIDKKWKKRYGYKEVPKKSGLLFKDFDGSVKFIAHPELIAKLRKGLG